MNLKTMNQFLEFVKNLGYKNAEEQFMMILEDLNPKRESHCSGI